MPDTKLETLRVASLGKGAPYAPTDREREAYE
jgi:hypothetical protein